jgi:hypothetical protein
MQQFNQFRTYAEGENMPITEDGIPGVMARNGGVSMKRGGALRTAARKVQSAGFGEDKILVHINPSEYAELIRKHGPVTYNDETGLPQLGFFKSLGKILKIAAPIILSVALPGLGTAIGAGISGGLLAGTAASALGGAILGAGTGFVTSGGKLKGALMGGVAGGLGGAFQGASSMGGLTPTEYGNLTFAQKAMVGNRLPGFFNATDPAKAVMDARFVSGSGIPGMKFDQTLANKFTSATPPSFLDSIAGKSQLTSSILNPAMKGLPALLTSPAGIMAGGYLIDALGKKKPTGAGTETGTGTGVPIKYPLAPGQTEPYSAVPGPNIAAPTLQQMAAVQQPQNVQLPDGSVVPASYFQNAILPNYAAQQNEYTPFAFKGSRSPVYARTGGLAQVKRYDAGGTVTTQSAPFVPTRRAYTADELRAKGYNAATAGETGLPAGFSFFTDYTTAPTGTTPGGGTPGGGTPGGGTPGGGTPGGGTPGGGTPGGGTPGGGTPGGGTPGGGTPGGSTPGGGTPVDTTGGGNFGDDTTNPSPGGLTPVGETTTDQYGTTIDSQGTVISANVDTSQYWDPTTGQYRGNWPGITQYLRDQEAARNTIGDGVGAGTTNYSQDSSQPEYFDSNYFDQYSGLKKGGALRQASRYVRGQGDGQADKIPAMLSDGEYVMDAESVSALGNGSSEAGAKKLDEFRMNLRKHKRSAPIGKIPPKTKKLNKYMSGGSR